jgi:hypothetical protein
MPPPKPYQTTFFLAWIAIFNSILIIYLEGGSLRHIYELRSCIIFAKGYKSI